jgi:ubiquinone/menaquinone biosynthesis C-methylase UbiE
MKIFGTELFLRKFYGCYDWKSLLGAYKKYVKGGDFVLEIGASNTERTRDLSRYCKKLIGIELFPERLPKNFDNVEYVLGDWQKLIKVIKKNSIDLCVASHVIEHVPDDLKAIN